MIDSNKKQLVCINCGTKYIKLDSTHWICPIDGNVIGVSDCENVITIKSNTIEYTSHTTRGETK